MIVVNIKNIFIRFKIINKKISYTQMNNANIYNHLKESIESMLYTSDELISGIKILILDNFTIKLIN